MMNYAVVDKLLEMYIARRNLLKELDSCTKFICLLNSIKVSIESKELSWYQIYNQMLNLRNIIFLDKIRLGNDES